MIFAGILAGGTGSRMGGGMPKQFLSVGGIPVIVRSVQAFLNCGLDFDGVFVAVSADYFEYTKNLLSDYGCANAAVIQGGTDRAESIDCVISAVMRSGGGRNDLLLTHDAARPFVTAEIIRQNAADTLRCGCAGVGIMATDTIFRTLDGQHIDSMPPRTEVYQMQTPQGFIIGDYLDCLASLSESDRAAVTDACGVFLRCGKDVFVTPGDASNIKLTRPIDLATGEFIAANAKEK